MPGRTNRLQFHEFSRFAKIRKNCDFSSEELPNCNWSTLTYFKILKLKNYKAYEESNVFSCLQGKLLEQFWLLGRSKCKNGVAVSTNRTQCLLGYFNFAPEHIILEVSEIQRRHNLFTENETQVSIFYEHLLAILDRSARLYCKCSDYWFFINGLTISKFNHGSYQVVSFAKCLVVFASRLQPQL